MSPSIRILRWILIRSLDPSDRDALLDDLEEEHGEMKARTGTRAAQQWLRGQLLRSIVPSLRRRIAILRRERRRSPHSGKGFERMDSLLTDLRFAIRSFVRQPAFSIVVVLTLAVGIGANTAVFSLANGIFFKGMPGVAPEPGLVEMTRVLNGNPFDVSFPIVRHIEENAGVFDRVAPYASAPVSVRTDGPARVAMGLAVTDDYFEVLGLRPSEGRFFAADQASYPVVEAVAIITERLRTELYPPEHNPIGSTLRVSGVPLTVIGVTDAGFRGHSPLEFDLFVPLGYEIPGMRARDTLEGVESGVLEVLATLGPNADIAAAERRVGESAADFLNETLGQDDQAYAVRIRRWGAVPGLIRNGVAAFMVVMTFLVGLLLAVACINVAGMVLARASARSGELGVRTALGADRPRLIRQLLTESLLLSGIAGGLGYLLALGLSRLLLAFEPPLPPGFRLALDVSPDWRVVSFSIVAVGIAAVLAGLAPAFGTLRDGSPVRGLLRDRSPGAGRSGARQRFRSVLVAGQMAASVVLLAMAAIFMRSLSEAKGADPGWRADGAYVQEFDLQLAGLSPQSGAEVYRDLLRQLNESREIESVALAAKLPLTGFSSLGDVNSGAVEPPADRVGFEAYLNRVTPGYFETLEIPILRGRAFQESDVAGAPFVAVVNRQLAETLWPGENAVGRRLYLGDPADNRGADVVGVVENSVYGRFNETTPNFYYLALAQQYNPETALIVRPRPGSEAPALATADQAMATLAPSLPVRAPAPLSRQLDRVLLPQRLGAWVTGVMGILGLFLSAVGVYGMSSYVVMQRTREMGIRIALGSEPRRLLRDMLGGGMVAPLVGIFLGAVVAVAVSRIASAAIGEIVRPWNPLTQGFPTLVLFGAAVAAVALPVLRALRSNPVRSLNTD